jgi:hypothetical protein
MKPIVFLLLLAASFTGFAQINYEPGYYVDNSGGKVQCLIKNIGWKNNPVYIDYKMTEGDEPRQRVIDNTAEFSVGSYKFKRYTVNIDRSSNEVEKLSDTREPEWRKETLFLKVLVEGKATLYQYEDNNLTKYFYSTGSHTTAEQLLYREYSVAQVIYENSAFRQQLYNLMKDKTQDANEFKNVKYRASDLISLFLDYNKGSGQETVNLAEKQDQGKVNFKITPGAGLAFLSVTHAAGGAGNATEYKADAAPVYRIGVEVEYVMPFNRNKWSIFADPNVQFYSHSGTDKVTYFSYTVTNTFETEYNFIELPVGFRHYMFLNNKSKIFIDATFSLALNLGSPYIKYNTADPLPISKSSNIGLGAGFSYQRYSAELRYGFGRGLLDSVGGWETSFSTLGLILGYKIF